MKIAVASDHRGFSVKGKVLARLAELGHEGLDFGPESSQSVDYPDYAAKVAAAVSSGQVDRGILICGTGMGMCIVANKFPGVRAAPCHDDLTAEMSRLHNDANVLCLSADLLGDRLVNRMVEIWLKTDFEGGRHARRLEKIALYEVADRLRLGRSPATSPSAARNDRADGSVSRAPLPHGLSIGGMLGDIRRRFSGGAARMYGVRRHDATCSLRGRSGTVACCTRHGASSNGKDARWISTR